MSVSTLTSWMYLSQGSQLGTHFHLHISKEILFAGNKGNMTIQSIFSSITECLTPTR